IPRPRSSVRYPSTPQPFASARCRGTPDASGHRAAGTTAAFVIALDHSPDDSWRRRTPGLRSARCPDPLQLEILYGPAASVRRLDTRDGLLERLRVLGAKLPGWGRRRMYARRRPAARHRKPKSHGCDACHPDTSKEEAAPGREAADRDRSDRSRRNGHRLIRPGIDDSTLRLHSGYGQPESPLVCALIATAHK